MIKFFRRIRQRIVTENKSAFASDRLSRYVIYAVGEILLVVIGILIALSINNWNQHRINENKELDLIKALDKELAVNQEYISERITELTREENRGKQLIKLTGPSSSGVSTDSLSRLLLGLIYQRPYSPIVAKYQHIMSSDDNNLIENDSLNQLLFEYQAQLDLVSYEQFEMRENIILYLQEKFSTLHVLRIQSINIFDNLKNEDYTNNYFDVDPDVILTDKKFQSMIVTRYEANGYSLLLLKGVLWHINMLRSLIQRHYEL